MQNYILHFFFQSVDFNIFHRIDRSISTWQPNQRNKRSGQIGCDEETNKTDVTWKWSGENSCKYEIVAVHKAWLKDLEVVDTKYAQSTISNVNQLN